MMSGVDQPREARFERRPDWEERGALWRVRVGTLLWLLRSRNARESRLQDHIAYEYASDPADVYLTKSGRSGLAAVGQAFAAAVGASGTVLVPSNTCNVVGDAFRAAGCAVRTYATSSSGDPDWDRVDALVQQHEAPLLVLCSMFGAHPWSSDRCARLRRARSRLRIVLDECQSFGIRSPRLEPGVDAIVTSFNDKALPGLMGGAVVTRTLDLGPILASVPRERRMRTGFSLVASATLRLRRRLSWSRGRAGGVTYEYSTAARLHHDYVPDRMYGLSAAVALAALDQRHVFERARVERGLALSSVAVGDVLSKASDTPVHVPLTVVSTGSHTGSLLVKRPYGRSVSEPAAATSTLSVRTNAFGYRYAVVGAAPSVVQLTSRHRLDDNRILNLMAESLARAGFRTLVLGPGHMPERRSDVELRPRPTLRPGVRAGQLGRMWSVLVGAMESRAAIIQFHDPDLLPIGVVLRAFGRRVIFDVHDDYRAALLTRLRRWRVLASVVAGCWHLIEMAAARIMNGVIVADRHLAERFASVHPVVLGNYPTLDFIPSQLVHHVGERETFNLLYVGGVSRERGLAVALEALGSLPGDVRLNVIGVGTDDELNRQLASNERVVLHGRVAWQELHLHYQTADVGLALYQPLPTFQYCPGENAVKVIEYMAAGIPIVTADFPGLRRFVQESGAGLCVQSDDAAAVVDAVMSLYRDRSRARTLGLRGRALFEEKYNWDAHEHALVALYARLARTSVRA